MNKLTNKKIHIGIIILGIIVIFLPIFHTNLWFDESYTVAISDKTFGEIWTIGGNDVHPVLYYWVLHVINLIFGNQIIVYRIFSALCVAIAGILGYTHIRKDFGEKAGMIFSFLTFFIPVNVIYAGEIRMYTFAMLLVEIMSIYGYRLYKNKEQNSIKNWILFSIFSLASAYTHYYGLMIAGIENLVLLIVFIIQSKKEKKITYNLKVFIIQAIMQVGLYMPWIISLLKQMKQVSGGFWINLKFPYSFIEIFTFPLTGNLDDIIYVAVPVAILFAIFLLVYMIYIHKTNKNNENLKTARLSIILWISVFIGASIVSIVMWRPILYARYFFCIQALFIFFISATMGEKAFSKINIVIYTISVVLSLLVICMLFQENYGPKGKEFKSYISENIKKDDILICGNEGSGFVISAYYPKNTLYFYNEQHWGVEEAYKAYGKTVEDLSFLDNYQGRIWVINTTHYSIYEQIKDKYDVELLDQKAFSIEYRKYQYTLTLIEK